jgi:diacylglycerol kinase family enzyme
VKRALVVSNPVASGVTPRVEAAVLAALAGRVSAELVRTERPMHAVELAARGAQEGFDAVIVMAGDGTMNEVLNGVGNRIPLGVLPCGGTSVLARSIGLSRDPTHAAGQIAEALRSGRERWIQLGTLNGRRFAFSGGVGLDADVVRRVDARGRASGRRPGDVYYASTLGRVLLGGRYRRPLATLTFDGRTERVGSLIAANVHPWTYVGSRPVLVAPHAIAEAGFDILAPRTIRRRMVPRFTTYLLISGGHAIGEGDPRILYAHDVTSARLVCDVPLPAEVDGDDVGDVTDVILGVDPEGARLLV